MVAASASASTSAPPAGSGNGSSDVTSAAGSSRFWCHECTAHVATRVDDGGDGELCCVACGGNFVEEVEADDPPEQFLAAAAAVAIPSEAGGSRDGADQRGSAPRSRTFDDAGPRGSIDHQRVVTPRTPPSAAPPSEFSRFTRDTHTNTARHGGAGGGEVPSPLTEFLQQLVSGGGSADAGGTRTTRIIRSNGTPVEFYVTSTGDGDGGALGGGGLFGLLTGALNAPFGGADGGRFAGNPGDYALGPNHLSQLINQLMQNDPNRHGAPPAAKEVVEKLPTHKVKQEEVDANTECAVCKDLFAVDDDAQDLPCSHSFHSDCIMPWLKMHNSCPVCRFELPTDDKDYEERRRHGEQGDHHDQHSDHIAASGHW